MSAVASAADVLAFWRAAGEDKWFEKDDAFDRAIRDRFLATYEAAAKGRLSDWEKTPDGALALIILCDQFPRHIHRRTARAFCGDVKARETARFALARAYPAAFDAFMRGFFYLPFGHSEVLADQELACALYAAFRDEESLKHAIEHHAVVARFGRFPHRNEVLGRISTEEELDYLKTANRYGQ